MTEVEKLEAQIEIQKRKILELQVQLAQAEKKLYQRQLHIEVQARRHAAQARPKKKNLIEMVFNESRKKTSAG